MSQARCLLLAVTIPSLLACNASISSSDTGGASGFDAADTAGESGNRGPSGQCYGTPDQSCTGAAAYENCVQSHCETQLSVFWSACATMITCVKACPCDANYFKCNQACTTGLPVDCMSALAEVMSCTESASCSPPVCTEGPIGGDATTTDAPVPDVIEIESAASDAQMDVWDRGQYVVSCTGGMCVVPAGPFMMGCNESLDSNCVYYEMPYHQVNVPAFEIDIVEVTVLEYEACANAGACRKPDIDTYCNWDVVGRGQHPVNCVDWGMAVEFCKWKDKRLCSEAEWEKAARGTDGRVYPWGNETASCDLAVMYGDLGGCGMDSTMPVGSKPDGSSPYGVMDMAGNVCEWVQDEIHYSYLTAPTDGSAWEELDNPDCATGEYCSRANRGGSFYDYYSWELRVSSRRFDYPADYGDGYVADKIGIRCCRSLSP